MTVNITFKSGREQKLRNIEHIISKNLENKYGNTIVYFYEKDKRNWAPVFTSDVKYIEIINSTPSYNNQNYVN